MSFNMIFLPSLSTILDHSMILFIYGILEENLYMKSVLQRSMLVDIDGSKIILHNCNGKNIYQRSGRKEDIKSIPLWYATSL